MDYIKIRFGGSFGQLQAELEETMDSLFRTANPIFSASSQGFRPQMDIFETPGEIILVAEMAGVNKSDLSVELDAKAVKIAGFRAEIQREPGSRFHLAEIPYGSFERTVFLPKPIDPDKVTASYSGGILQIRMAKQKAPGPQKVLISD